MRIALMEDRSRASRFLDIYPEVRTRVSNSKDFLSWKSQFKSVAIDGEQLWVTGGDQLLDADELVVEWARRQGVVSQAQYDQATLSNEGDES